MREAIDAIRDYALVCLTSPNGARLLFEALARGGARRPARSPARRSPRSAPAPRLAARRTGGIAADVVPERFVAESLVEALARIEARTASASSSPAPPRPATSSPSALRERGAEVDVVALYETVREQPETEAVEAAQSADYVTFTSSSTVRNLTEALATRFPSTARIVSIGPVTSEAVARGRPRGRRRSRAPRHRGPGRRPARRRRPLTSP